MVRLLEGPSVVDGRGLECGGGCQAGFDQQLQFLMQREARRAIRLGRVGAGQQRDARAVQDAGQVLVLPKLLATPVAGGRGQPLTLAVFVPRSPQSFRHPFHVGMAMHLLQVREKKHVVEDR